jgi:hypothetical protein
MKADALSRRPNIDTGNPMNEHLIILPLNWFKGMPKSVTNLLGALSNSTSKITLTVAGLEDSTLEDKSLDAKVKLHQDKQYQSLLQ